ncbi:MAG: hypothetical protein LBV23_01300 [Deltaproteobacteria bacterium]|nr:hypothetical protein [Deltaproteobacteria bacterium]
MEKLKSPLINLLSLWSILAGGGTRWNCLVKPVISPKSRKFLQQKGLIEVLKHRPSAEEFEVLKKEGLAKANSASPRLKIFLTEKGRRYLSENLSGQPFGRSPAATTILNWLLSSLDRARSQGVEVFKFLGLPTPQPSKSDSELLTFLKSLEPFRFMPGGSLRLAALRSLLPDWRPKDLDWALLELQKQGKLVLYAFDDPDRIGPDDERAALRVGGVVRHHLFLL